MKDFRSAYQKILGPLPQENSLDEISVICPFHEDHKRSASINIGKGLFHCLGCSASYNFIQFKKALTTEAPAQPAKPGREPDPIDEQIVRDYHFDLMRNQDMLDRLRLERGLSADIIRKYEIGWQRSTNRVAIPIRDDEGLVRNIRLYSFSETRQQKMISWNLGYGSARLWPYEALNPDHKYVVLVEGEMDRLLLADRGLNSVTSTGGAKTWKSAWGTAFSGLRVYVVYDMDQAGEEGSRKAAASIAAHAKQVKVVRLDLNNEGEDITDFFVAYGYDVDDLRRLIKAAPVFRAPIKLGRQLANGEPEWTNLGQSLQDRYHGRELMVPVIVSARRDERLHYPSEIMYACDQSAGNMCQGCGLYGRGEGTVRIKPQDSHLIDFVGISTKAQSNLARGRAGIPARCTVVSSEVTEAGRLEEVLVTPEIETAAQESMHLVQRGFFCGIGLDYNTSYVIRTRPTPFHKNAKIVHQITDAIPAFDSIESFEMTPDLYENLQIFQAKPGQVKRKLWSIAQDLQDHVTRIWDRLPMHLGMDLVWHSVLEFEFDEKIIRRGWLEGCVVGDTRTGKSEVAWQLQRHYGYGEIVSGENTSYAGLVGGAVKHDDSWFVKWGRLPLNDRRMIIIDEVTGMSVEEIALMSGVRETGIADITKIETQRANARTRGLWIGNVRAPKQDLGDYDYGCLALHDLIGQPEDIARFDFAMSAARDEVSSAIVNSSHPISSQQRYPSELASALVLWAWSRERDTTQFELPAVEACYSHAISMGANYASVLPLVMAENQRVKLARLAVAIAARLFSTEDGENLIVTREHVTAARALLDLWYSAPSFGYAQLSRQQLAFRERRREGLGEVQRFLETRPLLAEMLMRSKLVNAKRIGDYTGLTDLEAQEVLRVLTKTMMITDKGTHGYGVTPELKSIAERVAPMQYNLEDT